MPHMHTMIAKAKQDIERNKKLAEKGSNKRKKTKTKTKLRNQQRRSLRCLEKVTILMMIRVVCVRIVVILYAVMDNRLLFATMFYTGVSTCAQAHAAQVTTHVYRSTLTQHFFALLAETYQGDDLQV